jgi:hypothetical protein
MGLIQKVLEFTENENTIYQCLLDTAKSVLIGKFIAISICMEKSKISNKQPLVKQEQFRPQIGIWKEIIKFREKNERNSDQTTTQMINEKVS